WSSDVCSSDLLKGLEDRHDPLHPSGRLQRLAQELLGVAVADDADDGALHPHRQMRPQSGVLNLFDDRIDLLAGRTRFHDDDHALAPDENAHSEISLSMVISPRKNKHLSPQISGERDRHHTRGATRLLAQLHRVKGDARSSPMITAEFRRLLLT